MTILQSLCVFFLTIPEAIVTENESIAVIEWQQKLVVERIINLGYDFLKNFCTQFILKFLKKNQ